MQSDPIGLQGGLNTYAYAGSNPTSEFDLFGLYVFNRARGMGPFEKCPPGSTKRWDSYLGFYCETNDPPNPNCNHPDCKIYPPETNCACTRDCYKTLTGGGIWGSMTIGAICAKFTKVPILSGAACNAAVWAFCGQVCVDECRNTCSEEE